MNVFKSVIAHINSFVVERNRKVLLDATDSYLNLAATAGPQVLEVYRTTAHSLVNKTFEEPTVLLNFVKAANAMINHYGPELAAIKPELDMSTGPMKAAIKDFEAKLEALDNAVNATKSV